MAKFNVVQKRRRAAIADWKRKVHGDPNTGKLRQKSQPLSISGKRERKLLKKWRREQKEAVEKGLITMQDVEMAAADGAETSKDAYKPSVKFPMKKSSKLRVKQLKKKGKKNKKKSQKLVGESSIDAMVE
ncbi:hypothetical protein CDL12_03750 [Handroanthus impetiginosus]|uniref:Uncharacterized protein n=1 Tax=Handroanthus impetiginosus TaxID=429701 RepID=A0A2G9I165_9LAMI|nr:hypothetical protein CDL12_03750 [Handroanthus impetiginosus]